MGFSEDDLRRFSRPLSKTEDERCRHAIEMMRDALSDSGFTSTSEIMRTDNSSAAYQVKMRDNAAGNITIFVQGSYANNTNVRQHSDVDIAVVCEDTFTARYRTGINGSNYGFTPSTLTPASFKTSIQRALEEKFGSPSVVRGNKSIKVSGNSYRVDADCVPAFRYRDYSSDYSFDSSNYLPGIAIHPDHGNTIINYPEQHIKLGREKNVSTGHRYKKCVRIAKSLMILMKNQGWQSPSKVSSFATESLVWNVPDEVITAYSSLGFIFEKVLRYLYDSRFSFAKFKEANGIKPLCSEQLPEASIRQFVADFYEYFDYDWSA